MSKKDYILERLNQLRSLIEKNYEGDDVYFFPPNYIQVLDAIEKININDSADIELLRIMNIIWKKHKKICEIRKESGKLPDNIEKIFVGDIIDILKNKTKLKAVKFVRENLIDKNGEIFDIKKAKNFVEQIIEEFQL